MKRQKPQRLGRQRRRGRENQRKKAYKKQTKRKCQISEPCSVIRYHHEPLGTESHPEPSTFMHSLDSHLGPRQSGTLHCLPPGTFNTIPFQCGHGNLPSHCCLRFIGQLHWLWPRLVFQSKRPELCPTLLLVDCVTLGKFLNLSESESLIYVVKMMTNTSNSNLSVSRQQYLYHITSANSPFQALSNFQMCLHLILPPVDGAATHPRGSSTTQDSHEVSSFPAGNLEKILTSGLDVGSSLLRVSNCNSLLKESGQLGGKHKLKEIA